MFRQGDRERALGQPVSALMDRRKEGVTRSQSGFFNIVAIPMYKVNWRQAIEPPMNFQELKKR